MGSRRHPNTGGEEAEELCRRWVTWSQEISSAVEQGTTLPPPPVPEPDAPGVTSLLLRLFEASAFAAAALARGCMEAKDLRAEVSTLKEEAAKEAQQKQETDADFRNTITNLRSQLEEMHLIETIAESKDEELAEADKKIKELSRELEQRAQAPCSECEDARNRLSDAVDEVESLRATLQDAEARRRKEVEDVLKLADGAEAKYTQLMGVLRSVLADGISTGASAAVAADIAAISGQLPRAQQRTLHVGSEALLRSLQDPEELSALRPNRGDGAVPPSQVEDVAEVLRTHRRASEPTSSSKETSAMTRVLQAALEPAPTTQMQSPPAKEPRMAKEATEVCKCSCGYIFKDDSAFCGKCGSRRPVVKREPCKCQCGRVFNDDSRFCGGCGSKRASDVEASLPRCTASTSSTAAPPTSIVDSNAWWSGISDLKSAGIEEADADSDPEVPPFEEVESSIPEPIAAAKQAKAWPDSSPCGCQVARSPPHERTPQGSPGLQDSPAPCRDSPAPRDSPNPQDVSPPDDTHWARQRYPPAPVRSPSSSSVQDHRRSSEPANPPVQQNHRRSSEPAVTDRGFDGHRSVTNNLGDTILSTGPRDLADATQKLELEVVELCRALTGGHGPEVPPASSSRRSLKDPESSKSPSPARRHSWR